MVHTVRSEVEIIVRKLLVAVSDENEIRTEEISQASNLTYAVKESQTPNKHLQSFNDHVTAVWAIYLNENSRRNYLNFETVNSQTF